MHTTVQSQIMMFEKLKLKLTFTHCHRQESWCGSIRATVMLLLSWPSWGRWWWLLVWTNWSASTIFRSASLNCLSFKWYSLHILWSIDDLNSGVKAGLCWNLSIFSRLNTRNSERISTCFSLHSLMNSCRSMVDTRTWWCVWISTRTWWETCFFTCFCTLKH